MAAACALLVATLGLADSSSATASPAEQEAWQVELSAGMVIDGVSETRWSSRRPPAGSYDRIAVHHYRGDGEPFAALLYLPGTNMNGEVAVADARHNLWLYLARNGVDVFTLDYRTHRLPSGDGALDEAGKSALRGWNMERFVEDVLSAVALAASESTGRPLFLAGFSRGASLALAAASTSPTGLAGVVVLDGPFKSHRPRNAFDLDSALAKTRSEAAWIGDVAAGFGWQRRARLMAAATEDPDGPALEGEFSSVGEQLAQTLYRAWRPGGLANAPGGFSRPEVLARLLAGYDRYYPGVQNLEGRSIADREDDPSTPIDDGWGELALPLLAFATTGMGDEWVLDVFYSAVHAGPGAAELHLLEGYGHLDLVVGERALTDVFEPTLAWLRRQARAQEQPGQ